MRYLGFDMGLGSIGVILIIGPKCLKWAQKIIIKSYLGYSALMIPKKPNKRLNDLFMKLRLMEVYMNPRRFYTLG